MTAPEISILTAAAGGDAAPGNDMVLILFGLIVAVATAYAAGRLHQWYRQDAERELAFQTGYDKASHSLFYLATRGVAAKTKPSTKAEPSAPVTSIAQAPSKADPSAPVTSIAQAPSKADPSAAVTSIMQAPSISSGGRHAARPFDLEPKTRDLSSRITA